jgi:hypothetical protein
MNTNRGIEMSTSLVMTENARCTIRSSVCCGDVRVLRTKASHANSTPMPISVKAVGKPSMMVTTTRASISRPRWPLLISDGAGRMMAVPVMMIAIRMSRTRVPSS